MKITAKRYALHFYHNARFTSVYFKALKIPPNFRVFRLKKKKKQLEHLDDETFCAPSRSGPVDLPGKVIVFQQYSVCFRVVQTGEDYIIT